MVCEVILVISKCTSYVAQTNLVEVLQSTVV